MRTDDRLGVVFVLTRIEQRATPGRRARPRPRWFPPEEAQGGRGAGCDKSCGEPAEVRFAVMMKQGPGWEGEVFGVKHFGVEFSVRFGFRR
jgi:hypothetical protein